MVKNNLMTLKGIYEVGDEVLGLVEGLTDMGPFPSRYEIGMRLDCYNLILYMRKGKYVDDLKWDSMRKYPISWRNIYEAG